MRTITFIIVVSFIAVLTVVKRKNWQSSDNAAAGNNIQVTSAGYDDEKIGLFIHSFSKDKNVDELGVLIEDQIEDALSELLTSHHVCRVEFITVGYHLLVIIRAKLHPSKAVRKGGIRSWRK